MLLVRDPEDLRALLREAVLSCDRDFTAKGVTWWVGGDFGPVTGNSRLLGEALRNVIINAVESIDLCRCGLGADHRPRSPALGTRPGI
ncbi:MAG TPA: hypothetical protein DCM14_06580 [Clostridiales bacterium UBA8153]|nr:hypothetical protein [Clostridiales bacterium UBA8153]